MCSIYLTPGGTVLETIEKRVHAISWARLMPSCLLDFSEVIRMPELKLAGFGFVVKSLHLIIQRLHCGFDKSTDFVSYFFARKKWIREVRDDYQSLSNFGVGQTLLQSFLCWPDVIDESDVSFNSHSA